MNVGVLMLGYLVFALVSFVAVSSGRKWTFYLFIFLGLAALVAHGILILDRGIRAGRLPFTNTYETLILLSFLVVAIYFITYPRYRTIVLGGFAGLVASILLALTALLASDIEPLLPALKSNWLLFHVSTAFVGYASFAVAFCSATIFLFWDFVLSRFVKTPRTQQKIRERLRYLDWLTYRLIAIGFPFLTLGIVTGSVWADASWGRYWNWDPKETWSWVTWLVYAVCLHVRNGQEGLRSRLAALFAFCGFLVVMFTYFGVNFWLATIHDYA